MSASKKVSTALMVIVFIVSWINPVSPVDQALQSLLTLIAFYLIWRMEQKYPLSNRDFFLVALFLSLHSIAAHWLYSNVPYDHWCQSLFGFPLNPVFGWHRNHFDRFVHLMYGFCLTPPIASLFAVKYGQKPKTGFYVAITAIMVTGLWYEWIEWFIAIVLSPEAAEAYNGQQGDMWDPHKDMFMATIGSAFWAWVYLVKRPEQLSTDK